MAKHRHESDDEPKFITELRKKNRKLAIENAQLRKENRMLKSVLEAQVFETTPEVTVDVNQEVAPAYAQEPEPAEKYGLEKFQCPVCGAYTKNVFMLRERMYYKCDCGSKGKISQDN